MLGTDPTALPDSDATGLPVWQKLMVYAGEQSPHAGHPLSGQPPAGRGRRGIRGYRGDHRPHGDSFRRLRRRVPVVTVVVDTPTRIRDRFGIVAEMTDEAGLVTSEMVPAFRTVRSEEVPSRLRLAALGSDR